MPTPITFGSVQQAKKSWKLTNEQRNEIAQAYKNGDSADAIAAHRGIAAKTVYCVLKKMGTSVRSPVLQRVHFCNETVFDQITEESAYWIGFLMADGCVFQNKRGKKVVTLSLSVKDIDRIVAFRDFLGATHKVSIRRKMASIWVQSTRLVESLSRFGVLPRKTSSAKVTGLENNRHFWRGVIDGDGSVFRGKSKYGDFPKLNLTGSHDLVEQYLSFVRTLWPASRARSRYRRGSWYVTITTSCASRVLHALYDGCTVCLDRKRQRAFNLVSIYEQRLADRAARRICTIAECGRDVYGHGLCSMHWQRKRKELRSLTNGLPV